MKCQSPSIELVGIQKKFGQVKAVENLNIKIYKSEILGLLGRNGAGKTTLVDMITKVTYPSSGVIKFNEPNSKFGICYQH
jgi:ABC-type multidrug transport system ATPase subunit